MAETMPPLPPRVVEFIRAHITSLLQLEALLLVFEGGTRVQTAAEISKTMYLPEAVVADWLRGFTRPGYVVETSDGFSLPDDEAVYDLLSEVADTYVRRKVSVGRLVFGAPVEDPKVTLAEAFRLRRTDGKDR